MDASFDILEAPNFGIRDDNLRFQALTHPSYSYENPSKAHNQRLEFEGDAYLKATITSLLREVCVDWNEDRLTRLRSQVERTESLATFARTIQVDKHLRIGNGCQMITDKMLEDAFEAIIGAIHREGGQDRVEKLLFPFLRPTCEALAQKSTRTLLSLSNPLLPTLSNSPNFTNGGQGLPLSNNYTNGGQGLPLSSNYPEYLVSPQPPEPNPEAQNHLLLQLEILKKSIKCQNPVSALKEWRDQLGRSDIEYKFERAGYDHSPCWQATCIIGGTVVGKAVKPGKKQDAKSAAAQNAIDSILYNTSSTTEDTLRNLLPSAIGI